MTAPPSVSISSVDSTPHITTNITEQTHNGDLMQPVEDSINSSTTQPISFKNLVNLQNLLDNGFITADEYEQRRQQLINALTGTTNSHSHAHTKSESHNTSQAQIKPHNLNHVNHAVQSHGLSPPNYSLLNIQHDSDSGKPPQYNHTDTNKHTAATQQTLVMPHLPPCFDDIQSETATKFTYDLKNAVWCSSQIVVKIDTIPFANGALRLVYHLQDVTGMQHNNNNKSDDQTLISDSTVVQNNAKPAGSYVCKISMDIRDHINTDIYFRDVETQYLARYYAKLYNQHNPPKHIEFVKAWILRLDERLNTPYCAVERYIEGEYKKHSNNYGYISSDDRHTPEAYSHFTYESSQHKILVCDIQGVGDAYTDPQIHSVDRKGFGKGNLGQRGIDKFLQTHRCNAICKYLKLPPINANYDTNFGTLPLHGEYMEFESIKVVNISQFPRIGTGKRVHTTRTITQSSIPPIVNKNKNYITDYEDRDWFCRGMWCTIM